MDNQKDSNHSEGSTLDEQYINPKTGKPYSRSHIYKLRNPDKYKTYRDKRDASFWREYYQTTAKHKVCFCECCEVHIAKRRMTDHCQSERHKIKEELFILKQQIVVT